METREELEQMLTLPEHKIVKVKFARPDTTILFKCGFPLTMIPILDDGELQIGEQYSGNDFAVVKSADINVPKGEFSTGRIVEIVNNYKGERITKWIVAKIDPEPHKIFVAQESRITDIHNEMNVLWNVKDGTSKLDILIDEYLAKKQAEATIENAEME